MKKRISLAGLLFAAVFCALIGAMLNTASAESVSTATCDQLKQQMSAFPIGSFGYDRLLNTYNNQCQTIRPGCTSELDLSIQEQHCTALGQYGIRYRDDSDCLQVKCSLTPPASSSSKESSEPASSSAASQAGICPVGADLTQQALTCKSNNQNYEYFTDMNGCRSVRCIVPNAAQTSCPSPTTLTQKALACQRRGAGYESYTDGACKMIRCSDETVPQTACSTDADVNAAIVGCQKQNLTYTITSDSKGCRTVQCAYAGSSSSAESCPSNDELNSAIQVCKNSGMTYTTMPDNSGCRQVICNPYPTSESMFVGSEGSSRSAQQSSAFPDIDTSTLQGKAAVDLLGRGIIGGMPDGTFGGNKPVNRAEAAKFLLSACDKNASGSYAGTFKDVPNGQWYTTYVEAAAHAGIISGYADGTFKPGNTVNRAEFSKMISTACSLPLHLSYTYKDVSSKDWFAEYAGAMQSYDLFPNGPETLMQPNKPMSRNDVAIAIYQYLHH